MNYLKATSQRHLSNNCKGSYAPVPRLLQPAFKPRLPLAYISSNVESLPPRSTKATTNRISLRRHFSVSPAAKATEVVANPKKDDEGNEMLIEITARAATRLKEIMIKDSNPDLALRVNVTSGGCHGFQYLMSLIDISTISPKEDTVFEANEGSRAKVVMDKPSLSLLKGSKVDFTQELIGSQFKIVGNPAASSSCGCGTSFDIKM